MRSPSGKARPSSRPAAGATRAAPRRDPGRGRGGERCEDGGIAIPEIADGSVGGAGSDRPDRGRRRQVSARVSEPGIGVGVDVPEAVVRPAVVGADRLVLAQIVVVDAQLVADVATGRRVFLTGVPRDEHDGHDLRGVDGSGLLDAGGPVVAPGRRACCVLRREPAGTTATPDGLVAQVGNGAMGATAAAAR